jgi:Zn-dependent protease
VLLAEPSRTAYDLQFEFLGFPVRVTPFFWLMAIVLGYNLAAGVHDELGEKSPGQFVLLAMWVAAVFISILVHELGHAIAMRRYGQRAYVVLYHFGGRAIPDAFGSMFRQGYRRPEDHIIISLAGPGAQLLLAVVILLALRFTGFSLMFFVWPVDMLFPPPQGRLLPSMLLDVMLFFLIVPSIIWALFNLLPVFPLDGGQISRALFTMFNSSTGVRDSLILSLATAALAAVYFLSTNEMFGAIMFISLAVSSYQLLQMARYGGGPW